MNAAINMLANGTKEVHRGRYSPMVGFRVTPEERDELQYLANQLGMTVSDLIRDSLEARRQQVLAEAAEAARA